MACPCIFGMGQSFKDFALENNMRNAIAQLKHGLDANSQLLVDRLMDAYYGYPDCGTGLKIGNTKIQPNIDRFGDDEEFMVYQDWARQEKDVYPSRYNMSGKKYPQDIFQMHHGLKLLPQHARQNIDNKLAIDGGAYNGDSAVLLLKDYQPSKVLSFDLSKANKKLYFEHLKSNGIDKRMVDFRLVGLSNETQTVRLNIPKESSDGISLRDRVSTKGEMVQMTTLDDFLAQNYEGTPVGFIKYDLEGFGVEALQGMKETIRKYKPTLSLAIYHNPHEFFDTKTLLEDIVQGLNYTIRIARLYTGIYYYGEVSILAYPNQ